MCPIICTMPLSISIHALLAESDAYQSGLLLGICHFYPRSPCGERPIGPQIIADRVGISIHALLAESDAMLFITGFPMQNFYPRSPCGERPYREKISENQYMHFYPRSPCGERLENALRQIVNRRISIHALLAESDSAWVQEFPELYISIHALLAESDRGKGSRRRVLPGISIHALLAESDICLKGKLYGRIYFYPRSPCGERLLFP